MTSPARPTRLLASAVFANGIVSAMLIPYAPVAGVEGLGLSPATYASAVFLASLVRVTVSLLLGLLSDRIADRRAILIVTSAMGVLSTGLVFVGRTQAAFLMALVALQPLANALFTQTFAYSRVLFSAGDAGSAERRMANLRSVFSASWVIGPPIGGWIAARYVVLDVYGVSALAYLAICGLMTALRLDPTARVPAPRRAEGQQGKGFIPLAGLVGMAGYFAIQSGTMLTGMSVSLAIINDYGGKATDVGISAAICAGLEVPLIMVWNRLRDRFRRETLIAVAALLYAAYTLALSHISSVHAAFALQIPNAVATAALISIPMAYMQDLIRGRIGLSASMIDLVAVAATLCASSLFGLLATHQHYTPVFVASAMAAAVGGLTMAGAGWLAQR